MASYERNNWKTIKTKASILSWEIKVDKTIIQNPQEIAKEFNNFFTFVESKLAKKISNTGKKCQDFLASCNEKIQFEELKYWRVFEEAFKSSKQNKAAGFDNLTLIWVDFLSVRF